MDTAIAALAGRDTETAQGILDRLVAAHPDWPEAWNKRATLYFVMERDAESLADIRRTLELEPRHFGALCGFAQICLRRGERVAAAAALERALQLNPHLEAARAALAALAPEPPRTLN
jgi:tetratricopeptide (TPR) repeat protein